MSSTTLSVILAVLAIIVSVISLILAKRASERCDEMNRIVNDEIRKYMGFEGEQKIKKVLREELARQPMVPEPREVNEKTADIHISTEEVKPDKKDAEKTKETLDREIPLPTPITFYAGICTNGAFKHVTTAPDNKTIYTIYAESQDAVHGILNVDRNAYDKIAQTPDYLQNACTYSGNGTQLKVTKTGTVAKENGIWVVKESIVAEFN